MTRALLSAVFVIAALLATQTTSEQKEPPIDKTSRMASEWRDVYVQNGVPHCSGSGRRCEVELRLVTAAKLSAFHDQDLAERTNRINAILAKVTTKQHPACLIVTPHGLYLARMAPSKEPPNETSQDSTVRLSDGAARFYEALGLTEDVARAAVRDYCVRPEGTGILCFKSNVSGQIAARLLTAVKQSRVQDSELRERTAEINQILAQDTAKRSNPKLVLAFLVTPKGLFLAWTENSDIQPPFPQGTVTSTSTDDEIMRVLSLR